MKLLGVRESNILTFTIFLLFSFRLYMDTVANEVQDETEENHNNNKNDIVKL